MWDTERKIDVLLQWLWRMGSVRLPMQSVRENASAWAKSEGEQSCYHDHRSGSLLQVHLVLRQWAMDP